jgi:hypothetical protein
VQKALKLDRSNTDKVLIDKAGNFKSCKFISFGSHTFSVVYDDSLSVKLTKKEPFTLFRDSCSIYIITRFEKKRNNYYLFDIIQPCSGLGCEGTIKKERGYRLVKLNAYVL